MGINDGALMRGAALVLVTMMVAAAAASWVVRAGRRSEATGLEPELAAAIERGTLADLSRAQVLGRRLVLRDDAPGAAAGLAFACAVMAVDYGLPVQDEATAALGRVPRSEAGDGIAASAQALVALAAGDHEAASRRASEAAASWPALPHPLYALGRARARAGDPVGASRALEAAMVVAPSFGAARVAWAEARLDVGDAATAGTALDGAAAREQGDTRAWLLSEEVSQALDTAPVALDDPCRPDHADQPFEQAGCALARAVRARMAGDRRRARDLAAAAARTAPNEPRLLARIAVVLAQLGAVDQAASLSDRAARRASPEAPPLAWAELALVLGRGRAGAVRPGARPVDPEWRLLAARAALALGGAGALTRMFKAASRSPRDRDLALLLSLTRGAPPPKPGPPDDPVRAYVDGLRARLDGDLSQAAEHFGRALSGHGDACRAAGEYVATLRALKRRADPTAFAALRAENSGCINLPLAAR
jgi:tetratricopeptide (TPR) repeat protein